MANDLNFCSFIGRVGQDPEMKYMPDGIALANFSIACSESWKGKDGQKQEKTTWIRCVTWRKLAEIIGVYVTKGSQIYISGKYTSRSYDKDGQKHYVSEFVVDRMQMLGGKSQQAQTAPQTQPATQQEQQETGGGYDATQDIPF